MRDLDGCLAALAAESDRTPLEVLVVDRHGPAFREEVARRHPAVRVLDAPLGTPIPDLRAIAFAAATAPVVAVIEDHVQVPAGWAAQMLRAQRQGETVVGGAVENTATDRTVDWAAFLCEYSHLLPPLQSGSVPSLTGNNTTYRRELLERFRDATTSGRWEDHLHAVLRDHGIQLYCHPEIVAGHKKHYTIREYVSQRYLYARSYAGARVRGESAARRM
ncbi:MAG: glycosyltransferase, partial [Acidobacteriota bacterium]